MENENNPKTKLPKPEVLPSEHKENEESEDLGLPPNPIFTNYAEELWKPKHKNFHPREEIPEAKDNEK